MTGHVRSKFPEDAMQLTHTSFAVRFSWLTHATVQAGLMVGVFCTTAAAQTLPPVARIADLSGHRFGLTLLSDGVVQKLRERDITVDSSISQFGWQFSRSSSIRGTAA